MEQQENTTPLSVLFTQEKPEKFVSKKKRSTWEVGSCSVCGYEGDVLAAGDVLGHNFGSWQDVANFSGVSALCEVCIWGFKNKQFLRSPFIITANEGRSVQWSELAQVLMQPVSKDTAIIAPAGGRKVVAPYAKWGMVVSESGARPWTQPMRGLTTILVRLYKCGARGQMILEESIPGTVLDQVSPDKHDALRGMWSALDIIRYDKTLAPLFVKLSMNAKEVEG